MVIKSPVIHNRDIRKILAVANLILVTHLCLDPILVVANQLLVAHLYLDPILVVENLILVLNLRLAEEVGPTTMVQ